MAKPTLPEDLVDLERRYVSEVYDQIAPHFTDIKHKAWPKVRQFLKDLEPGSLVADVGCGNGRYLHINKRTYKLGSDRCEALVTIANQRGHHTVVADNLYLPYRDGVFDAAISIAVIHHFATAERRIQALRELARIVRPGGRLMICVWAFEQKHRRFDAQDVLVPWNKPTKLHRRRVTSKSSAGTGSDFSSTSSVSEDDLTTEGIEPGDPSRENSVSGELPAQVRNNPTAHSETASSCNGCSERSKRSSQSNTNVNGICSRNGSTESGWPSSCSNSEKLCTIASCSSSLQPRHNSTKTYHQSCCSQGQVKQTTPRPHNSPVRPSSLRLLHRHTADSSQSKSVHKHSTFFNNSQRRNIPTKAQVSRHITSCQTKAGASHTKDNEGHPTHRCTRKSSHKDTKDLHYKKESQNHATHQGNCLEPSTNGNVESRRKSCSSALCAKPVSIRNQFSYKQQAETILTVVRGDNHTPDSVSEKEEPSMFGKLKKLFMEKSKSVDDDNSELKKCNDHRAASSVWQDYYRKCVKDAEDDLQSFKSFCHLAHTDKEQDIFFREFVVREFPGSSRVETNHISNNFVSVSKQPAILMNGELHRVDSAKPNDDLRLGHTCNGNDVQRHERDESGLDGNGNPCTVSDRDVTNSRVQAGVQENGHRERRTEGTVKSCIRKTLRSHSSSVDCSITPASQQVLENLDSAVDEVFEDFATSMSACLTNLSRATSEAGESLGKSPSVSCQRYYHVFKEGELEELIRTHVPSVTIVNSYFDHANWCLIAEKVTSP